MKKLFAILFVITLALPAFSQVRFGIKAGASTMNVPEYTTVGTAGSTTIDALEDASWGVHAGIFIRAGIGPVYLQPEVVFATNTYEYTVDNATEAVDQKFNRLEIPVLLGIKLGPVRLNAGPSATVPIGSPKSLIQGNSSFDELYRGTTFGYQAGIGFDILNTITLDIRYGGSFAEKYGDSVTIGSGSNPTTFRLDDRPGTLNLSLGIMF